MSDHTLDTVDDLRAVYRPPLPTAVDKEIDHLDQHCRTFIAHSPFLVMGTADADGCCDVSPKGGPPGFVKVLDDRRLAWGDLRGNNRLDSFTNLTSNPGVGLLFMIPGLDETLRVNGTARLTEGPELLDACAIDGKRPRVAVEVTVEAAYIHCAKAYRRGAVWRPDEWPDTAGMPTAACMLLDHYGREDMPSEEVVAEYLEHSYRTTLWEAGGDGES